MLILIVIITWNQRNTEQINLIFFYENYLGGWLNPKPPFQKIRTVNSGNIQNKITNAYMIL